MAFQRKLGTLSMKSVILHPVIGTHPFKDLNLKLNASTMETIVLLCIVPYLEKD